MKLFTIAAACCLTLAFVACGSPGTYKFEDPDASGGEGPSAQGGADGTAGDSPAGGGTAGSSPTAGSSSNQAGAGGDDGAGGSGTSGATGGGGEGGAVEPPEPPAPGRPGQGVVTGGLLMSSKSFMLWTSTGDSPSGNGVATSTNYRLVVGVVGTTQP